MWQTGFNIFAVILIILLVVNFVKGTTLYKWGSIGHWKQSDQMARLFDCLQQYKFALEHEIIAKEAA